MLLAGGILILWVFFVVWKGSVYLWQVHTSATLLSRCLLRRWFLWRVFDLISIIKMQMRQNENALDWPCSLIEKFTKAQLHPTVVRKSLGDKLLHYGVFCKAWYVKVILMSCCRLALGYQKTLFGRSHEHVNMLIAELWVCEMIKCVFACV